jgi:hypothetical protein
VGRYEGTEYVPVRTGCLDKVIDYESQRRQLVSIAMLLGGGSAALVLVTSMSNLVNELNPVVRRVSGSGFGTTKKEDR